MGKSSTQLADFVRRTAELAALVISLIAFRVTHREDALCAQKKAKLERIASLFVGAAMCLGGAVMLALTLLPRGGEQGNVLPGLVIAALGVVTNSFFWLRYRALSGERPNAILAAQSRLYCAKSVVDACVLLALGAIALFPASPAALALDVAGSAFVSVYLLITGILAIKRSA